MEFLDHYSDCNLSNIFNFLMFPIEILLYTE